MILNNTYRAKVVRILVVILTTFVSLIIGIGIGRQWKTAEKRPTEVSQNIACSESEGPGYEIAISWSTSETKKGELAEFYGDLNADGKLELLRIFSDRNYPPRSLPLAIRVYSNKEGCWKEDYGFTDTYTHANELGEAKMLNNFQGYGRDALMFLAVSTGYGSGYSARMFFITYEDSGYGGHYQPIIGPELNELSQYKFADPNSPGRQIIVAKGELQKGEAHFEKHKLKFERWDWDGTKFVKTQLGTTRNKYFNTTIDEIIKQEPDVLLKQ